MFPMFCAEEKLKKKTSDRLISMIKRRNFVIEDIVLRAVLALQNCCSSGGFGFAKPFEEPH
jgi:hypothetical protein